MFLISDLNIVNTTVSKRAEQVKTVLESGKIFDFKEVSCAKVGYKSLRIANNSITDMCLAKSFEKCKMINRSKLGRALRAALTKARVERRLVCGLYPAIAHLEKSPEEVVLCVLPTTRPGDATTHIQAVLLQAFCYENCIPVIQVDSSEKLANYCGVSTKIKDTSQHCNCAIVTRDNTLPLTEDDMFPMSENEQVLTDFYECTLEEFPRPIIELPI